MKNSSIDSYRKSFLASNNAFDYKTDKKHLKTFKNINNMILKNSKESGTIKELFLNIKDKNDKIILLDVLNKKRIEKLKKLKAYKLFKITMICRSFIIKLKEAVKKSKAKKVKRAIIRKITKAIYKNNINDINNNVISSKLESLALPDKISINNIQRVASNNIKFKNVIRLESPLLRKKMKEFKFLRDSKLKDDISKYKTNLPKVRSKKLNFLNSKNYSISNVSNYKAKPLNLKNIFFSGLNNKTKNSKINKFNIQNSINISKIRSKKVTFLKLTNTVNNNNKNYIIF